MDFPIYSPRLFGPTAYWIFKVFPTPYFLDPRLLGTVEYNILRIPEPTNLRISRNLELRDFAQLSSCCSVRKANY